MSRVSTSVSWKHQGLTALVLGVAASAMLAPPPAPTATDDHHGPAPLVETASDASAASESDPWYPDDGDDVALVAPRVSPAAATATLPVAHATFRPPILAGERLSLAPKTSPPDAA